MTTYSESPISKASWVRPIDHERRADVLRLLESLIPQSAHEVMSVIDSNPSAHLPYHGTPHLYVVTLGAYELAFMEGLSHDATRQVTLAALFHDFDHQLSTDDAVNIKCAVEAVREHLVGDDVERIVALVQSTSFPYAQAPQDTAEGIMRDADILYSTLLVPDAQRFRTGLFEERGIPATEQDTIAFIIGHGLQTKSGAQKMNEFFNPVGGSN